MSTSKDSMSLAASVATFDGTNWIMFERTMTAYLRIQGFADLIDSDYKVPRPLEMKEIATFNAGPGEDAKSKELYHRLDKMKELSDNYIKNNDKVMGYLTLQLVPSLQAIVSEYHTACDVWARLKTLYGTPGTALIFVDFMKVIIGSSMRLTTHQLRFHNFCLSYKDWLCTKLTCRKQLRQCLYLMPYPNNGMAWRPLC